MSHTISLTRVHLNSVRSLHKEIAQLYAHIQTMMDRNAELKAENMLLRVRLGEFDTDKKLTDE